MMGLEKVMKKVLWVLLMALMASGYTGSSCGYGDAIVDNEKYDESLATAVFSVEVGHEKLSITWVEVDAATSYNIHLEAVSRDINETPVLTKVTTQPQVIENLENGKEYYIVVQSVGADGRFSKIPTDKTAYKPNSLFVQLANGDDVTATEAQKDTIKALKALVGKSTSLNDDADNLAAFSLLDNLAEISLVDKKIVDISPFSSFTKLSSLDLSENEIADLSPLEALEELQVLVLQKNKFSDLSVILKLEKLKELDVSFNDGINFESVKIDLSTLSSLPNATQNETLKDFRLFRAEDCEIVSLDGISWLNALEELDLSGNKIVTLDPLINWQKLKVADFSGNPSALKTDSSYQTIKDRVVGAGGTFTGVSN